MTPRTKARPKARRKRYPLDWGGLIRRLEHHGSADDPIWFNGEETTPLRVSYDHHPHDIVGRVPIVYFGAGGRKKGTILGMLRDRARMHLEEPRYREPIK